MSDPGDFYHPSEGHVPPRRPPGSPVQKRRRVKGRRRNQHKERARIARRRSRNSKDPHQGSVLYRITFWLLVLVAVGSLYVLVTQWHAGWRLRRSALPTSHQPSPSPRRPSPRPTPVQTPVSSLSEARRAETESDRTAGADYALRVNYWKEGLSLSRRLRGPRPLDDRHREELAEALDRTPRMVDLRLIEADLARADQDLARAEEILADILEAQPGHHQARDLLLTVLHERGRHRAAATLGAWILEEDPHQMAALRTTSRALMLLSQYHEAIPLLRRLVRMESDNTLSLNLLGRALAMTGEHREAVQILQQSIDHRPDQSLTYYTLATVHAIRGRNLEAGRILAEARFRFGEFVDAWLQDPMLIGISDDPDFRRGWNAGVAAEPDPRADEAAPAPEPAPGPAEETEAPEAVADDEDADPPAAETDVLQEAAESPQPVLEPGEAPPPEPPEASEEDAASGDEDLDGA